MTRVRSTGLSLLVVVPLGVALSACAGGSGTDGAPGPGGSGKVAGAGAAGCVENYSLPALTGRAFAFDGTVVEIDPAESRAADIGYSAVTFEVHEWFRGGDLGQVTIALPAPGQVISAGGQGRDGAAYAVGTRLLVSGEPRWGGGPLENPIGWMCGFTRYRDAGTTTQWRTVLTT